MQRVVGLLVLLTLAAVVSNVAAARPPPIPNWRYTNPNVTDAFLNAVAYNPQLDVAVAVGCQIDDIQAALVVQSQASTQLDRWNTASIPTTLAYFPSIVYVENVGFVGAMGGAVVVSDAGVDWTPVYPGTYLDSISTGNGLILALSSVCSAPAEVAVSTDGLDWTLFPAPFACSSAYYDIVYIDGYFYSMGETVIWKSENGMNWTKWSHTWQKIAPTDSLAVGIAAGIPASSSAPTPFLLSTLFGDVFQTLDDGVTWEALFRPKRSQYVGEQGFGAFNVFDNNYYYNVGNGRTFYSTDLGASWSLVQPPLTGFPYKFTTASNEALYLAVGPAGLIQSSFDGQTWDTVYEGITNSFVGFQVDAVHNQFVLSTDGGIYTATPPSTAWTPVQLNDNLDEGYLVFSTFQDSPTGVIWGNLAVGEYTSDFSYSFDLVNWNTSSLPSLGDGFRFLDLAFSPTAGVWVVSFDYFGYRQNVYASSDYRGASWSDAYDPPMGTILPGPVYGDNMFLLVGHAGVIYSSFDGSQWSPTQCNKCPSGELAYIGNYFISFNNESIYYTTGTALDSWTEVNFPNRFINTVTYFADLQIYAIVFQIDIGCVWYWAATPAGPWEQPQGNIITTHPGCVTNIGHIGSVYVAVNTGTNEIYLG